MKKILYISIIAIILLTLCCGCGNKAKERVVIHISVPELVMDCIAHPECKDTTQFLKIAWDSFAAQYTKYDAVLANDKVDEFPQTEYKENITDQYGTPDAVDLTFGGYFMLGSYIYEGHVFPLDDIITNKMYYEFSGSAWRLSRAHNNNNNNNNVYMLPFYELQNVLCYNKDLFRACGLERYLTDEKVIQGWSLEDWETILSTLKEKLPEGSYPMLMYAANNQGDTHTMIQLRVKGSDFFDENGLFHLDTPEGIAGLQWIKDNYDKGYYPDGCEEKDIHHSSSLFFENKLAFYLYNASTANRFDGMDIGWVNFPNQDAHGVNSTWITGFMGFDNGDPKKVEVIKDFLSYVYNSEEMMDYSTGGIPCSRNVVEKWHDKLPLEYEFLDNEDYSVDFTRNNPNWAEVRAAFWPHIQALLKGEETAAEAAAGLDRDCNKAINESEKVLHE